MKKWWKAFTLLCSFLWIAQQMQAQQRFFNLTYDQVKVEDVLPMFSYHFPLPQNYIDSTYTARIVYPQYIPMSDKDVVRYQQLTNETLPAVPLVHQQIVIQRQTPYLVVSFMPLVLKDKRYQQLVSFMVKVEASVKHVAPKTRANETANSSISDRWKTISRLSSGRWAKISVPTTGVYELTEDLIRQAGFSNLNRIHVYGYGGNLQAEKLTVADLIAHDDLKEVAQTIVNGRHLFYANGTISWETNDASRRIRNPYSDQGYYFITESNDPIQTIDAANFLASHYPSPNDYHQLHEVDNYAWYNGGRNLFENDPIFNLRSKTIRLQSPKKATAGKLSINLSAGENSSADIAINGTVVGTIAITLQDYDHGSEQAATYPIPNFSHENSVTITTKGGGPIRLDYISIAYDQPFDAPNLESDRFPSPRFVENIDNQNLHGNSQADMVIIIPTDGSLREEAERLKTFHQTHDGLKVNIVEANKLYNEFSSGTPDIGAYRRYLKMLYDRGKADNTAPHYLLLFGDCVWDNRMLTNSTSSLKKDKFLLCYESENSFNEVECYVDDSFLALLDDGEGDDPKRKDIPDLAVGRFPVRTAAQAKVMVDKTIAYASGENLGQWQREVMLMGDDGNNNLHMEDANEAADELASEHPSLVVKKVMWDAYVQQHTAAGNRYPDVRKLIMDQQAKGALVMDYVGHGSETLISHEEVLTIKDFSAFSNEAFPLWITASCNIMPFDDTASTIGETAVLNAKGGAMAFYGTTRTVYAFYNKRINMAYLHHVFSSHEGKQLTIGEAAQQARADMILEGKDLTSNKLQYALLGDPALRLQIPRADIVLDQIDSIAVSGLTEDLLLKAGQTIRLKGHIQQNDAFTGILYTTLLDAPQTITTRQNDKQQTLSAFQYEDRTKTLFQGSTKVMQGSFELSFVLPIDVTYTGLQGKMIFYAVNDQKDVSGMGSFSRWMVDRTSATTTDHEAPQIVCYLNSPNFKNGGRVNTTPYFEAQLSDASGINTSGSNEEHRLELIIDNDPAQTYDLNPYFEYDFGSSTQGKVGFTIPEVSEGKHKLIFRAWDVQNNMAEATLDFTAVKGLSSETFNVYSTENPAKVNTHFVIQHDRMGASLTYTIEVFDLYGHMVWKHIEQETAASPTHTIEWNLSSNNGNRLPAGFYLYRITLASEREKSVSQSKKLIIDSHL